MFMSWLCAKLLSCPTRFPVHPRAVDSVSLERTRLSICRRVCGGAGKQWLGLPHSAALQGVGLKCQEALTCLCNTRRHRQLHVCLTCVKLYGILRIAQQFLFCHDSRIFRQETFQEIILPLGVLHRCFKSSYVTLKKWKGGYVCWVRRESKAKYIGYLNLGILLADLQSR